MLTAPKRLGDRAFGLAFGGLFLVIMSVGWFLFDIYLSWCLWAAGGFVGAALAAPWVLMPLSVLWHRFAHVLGVLNNHLLLGLIYFFVITPAGLLGRLFGADLLSMKPNPKAESLFIPVERRMGAETMEDLF